MAVPFPSTQPVGYEWFDGEPAFDPERHLHLEEPDEVVMLAELGYGRDEIATKATAVGASSPFRMLSDEGAAAMLEVARRAAGVRPACGQPHRADDPQRLLPVALAARPVHQPRGEQPP